MSNSYKVFKTNRKTSAWIIDNQLAHKLGLRPGSLVQLQFGSMTVKTRVLTRPLKEGMGLSERVLSALNMPENVSLSIKVCGNRKFQLGPVIGLLTFPHIVNKGQFRRYVPYAERMRDHGLFYLFGPRNINPNTKTITGYKYDFDRRFWLPNEFPYPDVVMDRIYPNNFNAHIELEKVIGPNRIFNKNTLINKMDFFSSINRDLTLRHYLPETALFRERSLKYFLGKYEAVFIKPLNSMKGRGIIFVCKKGKTLICKYMNRSKTTSQAIAQPEEIFDILERLNKRKNPYLIQAAVNRMSYRNRPFNFRTMVVKDGLGQWSVPAIFAKLAEFGGFLTNNSSGASFIPLEHLFRLAGNKIPYSKDYFLKSLIDLSIETAEVLDLDFGPLGKIGLDIVIDTSGKLWLIEANGNPGIMWRKTLGEYPEWASQMYDYPIAYCHYLAGFVNGEVVQRKPD